MNYYGAKDLAASFRTVRKNTLIIAEDIPEDKYNFRPAEGSQTVAEMLTHIAIGPKFQQQVNFVEKRSSMVGFDFMALMSEIQAESAKQRNKAQIVALLHESGEQFAAQLDSLSDEFLAEIITMPPGGSPPSRSRFDMLLGVKEHEMHHRAQLMLIQRMLGIAPHLTTQQQARIAAMREAMAQKV